MPEAHRLGSLVLPCGDLTGRYLTRCRGDLAGRYLALVWGEGH
jgi:hypothetical protein